MRGTHYSPVAAPALCVCLLIWFSVSPGAPVAKAEAVVSAQEYDLPEEGVNTIGMKFRLMRPGSFMMGTNQRWVGPYDTNNDDARPVHRVEITGHYYIGVYEVTQEQFEEITGSNPSAPGAEENAPVNTLSWSQAATFCEMLSEREGVTYRLPTEAEWEYACRAGTTTEFYWGDTADGDYGWYNENSDGSEHAVGQKLPNAWGLHDMAGNVAEWCSDYHKSSFYAESPARDPKGPESGFGRVARGGTWNDIADFMRSSSRLGLMEDMRMGVVGFRCVREVEGPRLTPVDEEESGPENRGEEAFEDGKEAYSDGDYGAAKSAFENAARQGHAEAYYYLGYMYYQGLGINKDEVFARRCYLEGAKLGDPKAQVSYGSMLRDGDGGEVDDEEALFWFEKAADQDYALGIANLGYMYDAGRGVEEDNERAMYYYLKAAEMGDVTSRHNLAYGYQYGEGVPRDLDEAAKWYGKAAEQDYAPSMTSLGVLYRDGGEDFQRNPEEAFSWFLKAAEKGNHLAEACLGYAYEVGDGVQADPAEAARWYARAAEAGDVTSQSNLGGLYRDGRGVAQDYAEAFKWYRKAADQGDAKARTNLGYLCEKGLGVAQDYTAAAEWYLKAAESGERIAQYNLAVLYEYGRGVERNIEEAVKWYRKAAQQGDEDAEKALKRLEDALRQNAT